MPSFSTPDTDNIHELVKLFFKLYYRRLNLDETSNEPLNPGCEYGGWRSLIPQWIGRSPILDTAIKALAACFIGTQNQNEPLLNEAATLYLSALQQIQQVLPQPNSAERKDLVAATLVMSSIELFMSNAGGPSQLTHIEGATRFLHFAFEAQAFEELHMHILIQGVSQALISRSRYIFSSPSYHSQLQTLFSVPHTTHPTNTLFLQWSAHIVPLPNILHAVDNLSTSTDSTTIHLLHKQITHLDQALTLWYESVKSSIASPWTLPSASSPQPDAVPFPLQFSSLEACTIYTLYWASQLLLLDSLTTLLTHPSTACASLPTVLPDPSSLSEYASLICRSVEFCTAGRSFAASENMFLPLFVVAGFYQRRGDRERKEWCVRAFERIAGEQKIGFAIERIDFERGVVSPGGAGGVDGGDGVWG